MGLAVGITCYNDERWVARAIESALSQTDEVYVFDDASTDSSRDIIRRYPVTLVEHPVNTGSCIQGRRELIERAQADWLLHLDADDVLMPGWVRVCDTSAADWLVGNVLVMDETGKALYVWDYGDWPRDRDSALGFARQKHTTPISMKGAFRTAWLREHGLSWYGFEETPFGDDCRTCLEYLEHDPVIEHVPVLMIGYTRRPGQMTADSRERLRFQEALARYLEGI